MEKKVLDLLKSLVQEIRKLELEIYHLEQEAGGGEWDKGFREGKVEGLRRTQNRITELILEGFKGK